MSDGGGSPGTGQGGPTHWLIPPEMRFLPRALQHRSVRSQRPPVLWLGVAPTPRPDLPPGARLPCPALLAGAQHSCPAPCDIALRAAAHWPAHGPPTSRVTSGAGALRASVSLLQSDIVEAYA